MLDDVLTPDLQLVICGTAAGPRSAAVRAYYAGPGNKLWRTLATIGLTPHQFEPSEYRSLLDHGIGLTDIAKSVSGVDSRLPGDAYDRDGLRRKIEAYQPRILCFNGKRAAKAFLDRDIVAFGLQPEAVGATKVFVAPSTSGTANAHWDLAVWHELARLVRSPGASSNHEYVRG